jgi:hypothetical protein
MYEYHPVTPERLTDLARFSEAHGKFRYCSCMCWRLTSADGRNTTTNCPFGNAKCASFTRMGDRVDDGDVRQGHHVPHVPGDRRGRCTPDLAEATAVRIHRIQRGRGHVRRLPVAAIAAQSGRACTPRVGADGLRWSSPRRAHTQCHQSGPSGPTPPISPSPPAPLRVRQVMPVAVAFRRLLQGEGGPGKSRPHRLVGRVVVVAAVMSILTIDQRQAQPPSRFAGDAQLLLGFHLDGAIQSPAGVQRPREVAKHQRPVLRKHTLHRVHVDDAVENVVEAQFLQAHMLHGHRGMLCVGASEQLRSSSNDQYLPVPQAASRMRAFGGRRSRKRSIIPRCVSLMEAPQCASYCRA